MHLGLNNFKPSTPMGELDVIAFMDDMMDYQEAVGGFQTEMVAFEAYAIATDNLQSVRYAIEGAGTMSADFASFLDADGMMSESLGCDRLDTMIGTGAESLVESIGSTLKDWWEKIKAFFAKISEYVAKFWEWITSSAVRREAALKKIEERLTHTIDTKAWGEKQVKALSAADCKELTDGLKALGSFIMSLPAPTDLAAKLKQMADEKVAELKDRIANGGAAPAGNKAAAKSAADASLGKYAPPAAALKPFGFTIDSDGKLVEARSEAVQSPSSPVTISSLGWDTSKLQAQLKMCRDLNDGKGMLGRMSTRAEELRKVLDDQLKRMETETAAVMATLKLPAGMEDKENEIRNKVNSEVSSMTRAYMTEVKNRTMAINKCYGMYGKGLNMAIATVVTVGAAAPISK